MILFRNILLNEALRFVVDKGGNATRIAILDGARYGLTNLTREKSIEEC